MNDRERTELIALLEEASLSLHPFAQIHVPANAKHGDWIATTKFCNTMVTAFSIQRARQTISSINRVRAALQSTSAKEGEVGITSDEQKAQGARCPCHGADDYCPCQNAPDDETRKARREAK